MVDDGMVQNNDKSKVQIIIQLISNCRKIIIYNIFRKKKVNIKFNY